MKYDEINRDRRKPGDDMSVLVLMFLTSTATIQHIAESSPMTSGECREAVQSMHDTFDFIATFCRDAESSSLITNPHTASEEDEL